MVVGGWRRVTATALVGEACRHREEIEAAAARMTCATEVLVNPPGVERILAGADVTISAAGTTTWELCCLGRPVLLMAVADNQRGTAAGMGKAGTAVDLGWHEEVTEEVIADRLAALLDSPDTRQELGRRAAKLVDGVGAGRVAAALEGMRPHRSSTG